MAKIFKKSALARKLKSFKIQDFESKLEIVKTWHKDYHEGTLKDDKETSREQAFNQDFFIKILGYKEKPSAPYSLIPKHTTDVGQVPDVLLGHFNDSKAHIASVVELKPASVPLDKPQQRAGNLSPIQQAFKYKTQYPRCPFVLATNFFEFRLFQDNQLDYEQWTLDSLVDPKNDYFEFRKFYYLLCKENFTSVEGKTKTEDLLSDIRVEQEKISKKFYKEYKELRLRLLRNLYKNNASVRQNIDLGIEKAQKIIDRIVFVGFCEDGNLLPENSLHRVLSASENSFGSVWSTLKGFFEAIDKGSHKLEIPVGYNGGLFKDDPELNNLKIDDDVLVDLAGFGKYDFEEDLSVTILGHIFEQSITDLEEIKEKTKEAQGIDVIESVGRRKKEGVFYTPDYIVDYIVKNSLGKHLNEKENGLKKKHKLNESIQDQNYKKREVKAYTEYQHFLENIRVLDPACGSGAFLVKVVDFLLAEHQRVGHIIGNLFSSEQYAKAILKNNVFGVDLNSESVEITKLSLWLKTAKKGKKLTALDENIKCGNSLIDDSNVVGNKAFKWENEFKEIIASGGFDVVVGNPPYVRQELLTPYKPFFASHYKCFSGTTDLFAYFYELGLRLLKKDGRLSYISNSFAKTTGAGEVLRQYLVDNSKFEQVVDFGTTQVFTGATTYPTIFVLRKGAPVEDFIYLSVKPDDLISLSAAVASRAIKVQQTSLKSESWVFEDESTDDLRKKIANNKIVSQIYGKCYRGVVTGYNEAFIIDEASRNDLIKKDPRSADIIKPFWEGKDIERWASHADGKYLIFAKRGIDIDQYSAIKAHLEKYQLDLNPRTTKGDTRGRKPGTYKWYEIQDIVAYYKNFEKPKIVWPNLQSSNKFCWDDLGIYINAPAVILPTNDRGLLGILNSNVVWFYLQGVCVVRSGGYLEVKPQYFSNIPVPEISSKDTKTLTDLVDSLIAATQQTQALKNRFTRLVCAEYGLTEWKRKLSKWWTLDFVEFVKALNVKGLFINKKDDLLTIYEKYKKEIKNKEDEIRNLEQSVNALVYELYGLTRDEIKMIETSLSV